MTRKMCPRQTGYDLPKLGWECLIARQTIVPRESPNHTTSTGCHMIPLGVGGIGGNL